MDIHGPASGERGYQFPVPQYFASGILLAAHAMGNSGVQQRLPGGLSPPRYPLYRLEEQGNNRHESMAGAGEKCHATEGIIIMQQRLPACQVIQVIQVDPGDLAAGDHVHAVCAVAFFVKCFAALKVLVQQSGCISFGHPGWQMLQ